VNGPTPPGAPRPARGKVWRTVLCLLPAVLLSACGALSGARLAAPDRFGMSRVDAGLYLENGADAATRARLLGERDQAEAAIRAAYGDVVARPVIHACVSEACYESFGGKGSRAKVYGVRILLSPRGLNWHYLAHEWSHAEMWSRLSLNAWLRLPQWFDEGVAVAISAAPENSEEHWQFLVSAGVPRPPSAELRTFRSLRQWEEAVERYGEKNNAARRARGEAEVRPVYTAAGHELRPWLAKHGSRGLQTLLRRLNEGAEFDAALNAVE